MNYVQVKKDGKMEEETEKEGKNVAEIVEDISSGHLEEQEEESFPCDDCGKTCGTKAGLRTHMYSHNTKEVANVQEIVENIYSSRMEEQNEVVKENFPCEECGKTYGTKASLRTHKYNHTRTPGPVKNEKLSTEERDGEASLVLEDREEMDRSLDRSLERSLDRSLDRSFDRSTDRSPMETELEERIDAITELRDGLWTCIQCGKQDKTR